MRPRRFSPAWSVRDDWGLLHREGSGWADWVENDEQEAVDKFVAQRGTNDCMIAACATATDSTYEQVAAAFGIEIDPRTTPPNAAAIGEGIRTMDIIYPLLELGWVAAPVFTAEHPNIGNKWLKAPPTSEKIKERLPGQRAIISYHDKDAIGGNHSIAWNGNEAIDCSKGVYMDLSEITILEVTFLAPDRCTRPKTTRPAS